MSETPVPNPARPPSAGGVAVGSSGPERPAGSDRTRALPAAGTEPVPGYRLVHRLGRGGFGEVWRAEGPGGVPVALKFIFLGGKAADVELRALELMKGIRHPHLLGLSGAWRQDELLILALELADGSLADRLHAAVARGLPGLPRDELLRAVAEAAEGIDHLNAIGIQHRDVKPANLLVVGGGVKVADFGLAKVLAKTAASHSGSMTLAYAAPECFGGLTSASTDQYALAVSYCELRGNNLPFMGQPAEMMARHVADPPDLTMVPAGERPALERALAKRAADRWPDCRSFVAALAAVGAEPAPAGPSAVDNAARRDTGRPPQDTSRNMPAALWSVDSPPIAPPVWRKPRQSAKTGRVVGAGVGIAALAVLVAVLLGWRPFSGGGESPATPVPSPAPAVAAARAPASGPPDAEGTPARQPEKPPADSKAEPGGEKPAAEPDRPPPKPPAPPPAGVAGDPQALAVQARAVLKAHCYRCHSGDGSSSGYPFDVTRHETLVKPLGADEPVVAAGSLEKSPLWDMVSNKRMPQRGSPERDSFGDEQRAVLRQWIEAGAPPFPAAADRPYVSLKAVLTAVRDHLSRADRDTRPYLRYFSLAHVHDNPAVTDEDLRYYRAALSKVVNSLSWKPRVAVPEAVDKAAVVFVVDVRALDWDRDDLWRKVIDAYPYGLRYGSHPDRDLRDLDREVTDLSKCDLPWVRADWFVATASRPPLYHDLLQLPRTAQELEQKLGVDVADDFRKDKLARAGFAKSGVSGQNRMVERHDSLYGAYWKSYDFLPDNGRANLTRFPLGPIGPFPPGHHPYPNQAFRQDGGEIVFNLPNGLQGYLLVDAKDCRINAGPIAVVGDDRRVAGTPEIVTGVSCMACHGQGMIPFTDFVRDHSAVFGVAEEKVKRLYPEQRRMDELVEADRRRFLDALEKAAGPFLRAAGDKGTPLTKFKEPVAEVVIPYRRGYLDLKAVALELFVGKPEDLLAKVGERRFKELGLEALTKPGGAVGRLEWEAVDGYSLMQEVARELRFTPLGK